MAIFKHNDIDMDRESESDSKIEIDEMYSSDIDSDGSNDDSAPAEQFVTRKWIPTNRSEMYTFLPVIMLMSITRQNKIHDYWSTDPMILTCMFGQLFARDRFIVLLRYLHFNDDSGQTNEDRLHKFKPVIDKLHKKFKLLAIPHKNLCLDESLIPWKGRLTFKQYIPTKRYRFGINVFVLCDCPTGAVLDFIVYTGSFTELQHDQDLGIFGSVATTLMKSYLNKGHSLFCDNWYTSPRLFEKLHDLKTTSGQLTFATLTIL